MQNNQQEPPDNLSTFQFSGRLFRRMERPIMWHVTEMDAEVIAAGLNRIKQQPGETAEAFAGRIWELISGARKVYTFLGLLLIPAELKDEDWTPEVARQTGVFLHRVSAAEEQRALRHHLIALVLDFFVRGLASSEFMPTASETETTAAPPDTTSSAAPN